MRRHGQMEKLDERKLIKEALLGGDGASADEAAAVASSNEAATRRDQAKGEPAKALEDFKRKQRVGAVREGDGKDMR
jgi:hypothetical protein